MRHRGRIDANQQACVDLLRSIGCRVTTLAAVGGGVPDLLVGYAGQTFLIEVKNLEGRAARKQKLTEPQETWHRLWNGGSMSIAYTPMEAVLIVQGEM